MKIYTVGDGIKPALWSHGSRLHGSEGYYLNMKL